MASVYCIEQNNHHAELSPEIQQRFRENQQTEKIYEEKDRWRLEIERFIQELYPSCRLVLTGSSANGFGAMNSDIDLVLCFITETESYALRRLESLFNRRSHRFKTEVP